MSPRRACSDQEALTNGEGDDWSWVRDSAVDPEHREPLGPPARVIHRGGFRSRLVRRLADDRGRARLEDLEDPVGTVPRGSR